MRKFLNPVCGGYEYNFFIKPCKNCLNEEESFHAIWKDTSDQHPIKISHRICTTLRRLACPICKGAGAKF